MQLLSQLIHGPDVATALSRRHAGMLVVGVGVGQLHIDTGHILQAQFAGQLLAHAVLKAAQREDVTLGGLIYIALAGGGIDEDDVLAGAQGQVAVVHPAQRHHLGPAHAGDISAHGQTHGDTVALQAAAVGGADIVGQILALPVLVVLLSHLHVGAVAAGGQDHALVGVGGDLGAVVLDGLHAGDLATLGDQLGGGGAGHDLIVLVGGEHGVLGGLQQHAPVAVEFLTVDGGVVDAVDALPQAAHQSPLDVHGDVGALIHQPVLQVQRVIDKLAGQLDLGIDPLGVVGVGAQAAVVGLEQMQLVRAKDGQVGLLGAGGDLLVGPVDIGLDLALQGLQGVQILGMDAPDGVEGHIAGLEGMVGIHGAVKRLLRPGEDGL